MWKLKTGTLAVSDLELATSDLELASCAAAPAPVTVREPVRESTTG
jgi:hypothetical protein